MLGYTLIGTSDLKAARVFFDKVFAELGVKRLYDADRMSYWGEGFTSGAVGVCYPFDGKAASYGNGTMLALQAPSRAAVDAAYRMALAQGGRDEGKPGVRAGEGDGAFYCAYFRDLDGNKFSLFRIGAA